MNRAAALPVLMILLISGTCPAGDALLSLNSLTPVTENFDSMGSEDQAELPLGWQFNGGATFSGVSHTTLSAGTSGAGAVNSASRGAYYNWGSGVNDSATDRAPGFLIDGLFPANKNLFVGFLNNTASTISELQISYDVEKYRNGTSSADINFFYGFNGINWTQISEATVHYNADASNSAVDPPASISRSVALSSLNISDQSNFYFRWQYAASQNINGKGLGVDNVLITFSAPKTLTWSGPNGGSWDETATNWKDAVGTAVSWNNSHRDRALFATPAAGVGTSVNISAPRIAGAINFDSAAGYTISGASLTIADGGSIQTVSGSHTISAPLILQSNTACDIAAAASLNISGTLSITSSKTLTKTGPGLLRLSGPRDFASGATLHARGGTVILASDSATSKLRINIQSAAPGADALVVADADQDLSELSITNDPGKQGLDLHSPAQAGAFRSIRIYASDLQAAKSTLYSSIVNARSNSQDGIFDSSRPSHPNSTIGIGIVNDHILIRPTRIGDVNLDGQVTIADFIDLSSNFSRTGVTWQEGDINGDGMVTIADFIDLAANFNMSYSGQLGASSSDDAEMLQLFAATHSAGVPEPALVSICFMAALVTARPRRVQSAK